jgi:diphosphomevalonate decarboxylase
MPKKATVRSPSNIAFIKYWGARDLERAIPENPSLSMTLRECTSRCTVEHRDEDGAHEVLWREPFRAHGGGFETAPPAFASRVVQHLDRLRDWAGCGGRFRVATENTFPAAAGIASSASGFSALTLATLGAVGRVVSVEEQSELARLSGSGSAARSVLGGYVEWPADGGGERSYARQVAPAEHWDLRDVIAVVESGPKQTSSLDGHRRARTSPYFETRLERLPERFAAVRDAVLGRDLGRLGPLIEAEAVDLHAIAMTSEPAIFYWQPATLEVLAAVRAMRGDGLEAWSTMDAGANVHVICTPASEPEVAGRLAGLAAVEKILRDGVGPGPAREDEHLL